MTGIGDTAQDALLREHPSGIWLILQEETPPDQLTVEDLVGSLKQVAPIEPLTTG